MFTAYEPERHGVPDDAITARRAQLRDADEIAHVMSARDGFHHTDHLTRATHLFDRLPVVVVAQAHAMIIGWSGAQIIAGRHPGPDGWYVAGLEVSPAWHRHGTALKLLAAVADGVARLDPGATLFSICNATNQASLDLHLRAGFRQLERGPQFVGVTFEGGRGVLLAHPPFPTW
ncbi:MAG: GNAT family N-acetyltransferase [Propionibacteriaceae bacterium]|nr:GNAT family N-acetyltransferase [Propionibacteriaceae bacterium]